MVKQTVFKVHKYKAPEFTRTSTGLVTGIGAVLKEGLENHPVYGEVFKEQFNKIFKESSTTTDVGAYTTMLASIMQTAAIDDEELKKAESLVFINTDMMTKTGFGAYQIPRLTPTIALEVAEGSVISYYTEGTDAITVTPRKYLSGTKITWEIKKRGMDGMVKWVLGNAKDAVIRKRISNIVNGLAAGAGQSTTGGLTYAKFVEARQAIRDAETSGGVKYNFAPNWFVVSSEHYSSILTDTDFKSAMYPANANPGLPTAQFGIQMPLKVLNCEIWETPMLTGAYALVLDSKRAAMLIKEAELEVFEGRLPQSPDDEILVLESSVLAIMYPKAICKMTA